MKRNVLVGVRFSPEEHAYLCGQAEKDVETQKRNGTKNLSAYIRKRVLERSGYQEEMQIQKSLKELTYQFRKIGTNINQATKQLHIGYEAMAAANRLEKNMKVLDRQMENLKEEFKQIYGNYKNIKH
ncbi:plasmid mobilization protein [Mediterraneibacter gnavus]|uniref:MobC family plasmid mobilization relaxosome protein n=1 Tax=Mediterraneibacter gnavus TaxID=33038 RepID=A0AAJ1EWZ6_MEDGN|nr:plasmid mobilization relaxosome protein MobC [Mediterraneibacter gnavus]MCB5621168.1 MobC family plasmid mobilization relaxosome protein [Mediterraneibacter gnavus]MCB5666455.1 MobC family plasmid mobilization relaxosome protein [Mediterraneibacter gnavus]MCB5683506.1 MobC family plasmid mobilization relaxosome protein [Mediterraneibacter gnavus]NSH70709.1 MobC family plasmid mobilization relaxosome protein [Mediterraneibacter gnavus]NSH80982.1 MobC family plasmid mobilization relaxosome pr